MNAEPWRISKWRPLVTEWRKASGIWDTSRPMPMWFHQIIHDRQSRGFDATDDVIELTDNTLAWLENAPSLRDTIR